METDRQQPSCALKCQCSGLYRCSRRSKIAYGGSCSPQGRGLNCEPNRNKLDDNSGSDAWTFFWDSIPSQVSKCVFSFVGICPSRCYITRQGLKIIWAKQGDCLAKLAPYYNSWGELVEDSGLFRGICSPHTLVQQTRTVYSFLSWLLFFSSQHSPSALWSK